MDSENQTATDREALSLEVDIVCDIFSAHFPQVSFRDQTKSHIAINILELGLHEVVEAMDIAVSKTFLLTPHQVLAYFFGVCRNKKNASA